MNKSLKKLADDWDAAGERYFAAFRKAYPIGAPIRWEKRGFAQTGQVIGHCYQDNLLVRNYATDKEYVIHSYWVRS